jgi:DNA-directed RNA polymerase specialized sigma subunit
MTHVQQLIAGVLGFVAVAFVVTMFKRGTTMGSKVRRGTRTSGMAGRDARTLLAADINSLSEREKIVITLYYFEGLTLAEISDILGVSESHVVEIHFKAVAGIRARLAEYD